LASIFFQIEICYSQYQSECADHGSKFYKWEKLLKRAHFNREFLFSPLSLAIMSCGGGSESSDDLNSTEALSEISLCMMKGDRKNGNCTTCLCIYDAFSSNFADTQM